MDVKSFYAKKNIFLTGASGFVGLCLLEKILRTIPDHGDIYLLLRGKRGKDVKQRLNDIKGNAIFEGLLQQTTEGAAKGDAKVADEQVFGRVFAIEGDVGMDGLGINEADRRTLSERVHIIIHSAATLDFADPLKETVRINLLGTRRMVQLARECSHLVAFCHISSAYVNAFRLDVREAFYETPVEAEELIRLCAELSDAEMELRTDKLLGTHPNTYTITKQLAEYEVQKVQSEWPCTIVRPSMIVGSWKEPVPGWTVSKNGPQGFLMGASKGVIRRLPVSVDLIYDYIPVDIVVNSILVATFRAAVVKPKQLSIYHCTSSTRNPFRWSLVTEQVNKYLHEYPLLSAVWYPHLKFLPSVQRYRFSSLFVHMLPALLLDMVTRITGGRPILVKLHRNVNTSLDRLEKFIFTEWKFHAEHTAELHRSLSKSDQEEFGVDIASLDWIEFCRRLTLGVRVYLNREPIKTLSAAKTKDSVLWILHLILQATIVVLFWYLFACLLGCSMKQCLIAVPIIMVALNFL